MKLIHNFKSPNFNERGSNAVKYIVIHYTALNSAHDSIKYLCSKQNKVSSHYLISSSGKIYSLVSEKKRAWHAGQSYWNGEKDLNSTSIGIELDYSPIGKNNIFTDSLKSSLIYLLNKIKKKYKILPQDILGHSDIAPYRKIDPGKDFPWDLLEKNKVIKKIIVKKNNKLNKKLLNKWFHKNSFNSKKKKILFMLNYIGYDTSLALEKNKYFNQLLMAYSLRHQFYKNHNYNKTDFINVIINHFINIILTKLKK